MLEGTLGTFTLPDIFQLLANTKKTGCLVLSDDHRDGRVWFKDGEVFFALASGGRLALGRRLIGAGVLTTDQLKAALEVQRDSRGLRLGSILVDQGAVDAPTLEMFVREQIQDAAFDLLSWSEGSFRFEGTADTDEPIGLTVSVENLIMESSRRLEEWDTVRRKIPTARAVVAMAPEVPHGEIEVSLKADEWRLLTLVDGQRTIIDLVEITGQSEFAICKVLFGMVGTGLLEVRDPDLDGPPSISALLQQHDLLRELERSLDDVPTPIEASLQPAPPEGDDPDEPTAADEPEPTTESEVTGEPELAGEPEPAVAGARGRTDNGRPGQRSDRPRPRRIATDPTVDPALLDRLIEGVKGL
jgi:uncharacterized protein DUF4388